MNAEGLRRRARSVRDGNAASLPSVPNSGREASVSFWTTSAITATPGFRAPTPPPRATGSALGSLINATASRGACSIPIAQRGSRSCRAGPGVREPGDIVRKPRRRGRFERRSQHKDVDV